MQCRSVITTNIPYIYLVEVSIIDPHHSTINSWLFVSPLFIRTDLPKIKRHERLGYRGHIYLIALEQRTTVEIIEWELSATASLSNSFFLDSRVPTIHHVTIGFACKPVPTKIPYPLSVPGIGVHKANQKLESLKCLGTAESSSQWSTLNLLILCCTGSVSCIPIH